MSKKAGMVDMEADMHIHTTASDGTDTPEQVVAEAATHGLKAIAITDHDCVDGVASALKAANGTGLEVIAGVEISTLYGDEEVHILGYFIDPQNSDLRRILEVLRNSRKKRVQKIVRKLQEIGVPVDLKKVTAIEGGGVFGRPHIARVLVADRIVSNIDEAFEKYLDKGKPAYVPRFKLTPEEAVSLIRGAGGAAVLAHPGLLRQIDVVEVLAKIGLMGIEVFYPIHDREQIKAFLSITVRYGLVATGGSDYHGKEGKGQMGEATVPYEAVRKLKESVRRSR